MCLDLYFHPSVPDRKDKTFRYIMDYLLVLMHQCEIKRKPLAVLHTMGTCFCFDVVSAVSSQIARQNTKNIVVLSLCQHVLRPFKTTFRICNTINYQISSVLVVRIYNVGVHSATLCTSIL